LQLLGSSTILVNEPGHEKTTGNQVVFTGVSAANGFTQAVLNTTFGYSITVLNTNQYNFNVSGTATTNGYFGGSRVSVGPAAVALPNNAFEVTAGSSTLTVNQPNHGKITGNTVKFQNLTVVNAFLTSSGFQQSVLTTSTGYSITVVNLDNYRFNASSGTRCNKHYNWRRIGNSTDNIIMALTYSQLVTQIRNYTEVDSNGLSDSTVAVIVQNTENRIYRELNIDAFRLYASAVTTAGTTTISVPSGLRNIRYVEMISPNGEFTTLEQKDSSYMSEFNNFPASSTYYDKPRYWANWNETTWFVAPTPSTTYSINIAYYSQGNSITAGNSATSTTYISTYAQDLLLYGSLVEAYKYLKGPDNMIQVYEQSYQQSRESFGVEQTGRRRRDEYVDGEPRVVVDSPPPGK
jgi:hypothetical protein